MKRWDKGNMMDIGNKLFRKILKRKYLAHHNHEIHFLSREINEWLPNGIESLINGNYSPRLLKRIYFEDGAVDQLHLSDRILQNILLQEIKRTFPHVLNPNCTHLAGPSGVKTATQRIRQALEMEKPNFIIRADIKSYYSSIVLYKLQQDIKKHYDDPKLIDMLKNIITNPIETAKGYKNPVTGIALRGPLSQFFSALYLKPLDDIFSSMKVSYFRYNDDFIILCKTKKQLARCKRKMMEILQERGLKLSGKKTQIGSIHNGFNFLGVKYPGSQPLDNTNKSRSDNNNLEKENMETHDLCLGGQYKSKTDVEKNAPIIFVPHPRTLRKAREQVKCMVKDGLSALCIRNYLHLWTSWWVRTSEIWEYETLLKCLIESCFKANPAADYATGLRELFIRKNCDDSSKHLEPCRQAAKTSPLQSPFASELLAS